MPPVRTQRAINMRLLALCCLQPAWGLGLGLDTNFFEEFAACVLARVLVVLKRCTKTT